MKKNTPTFDTTPQITEWEFSRAQLIAKELAACSHAPTTLKKYEADWRHFTAWCRAASIYSVSICALPSNDETLATYVAANLNTPPSSLKSRLAAIRFAHKRAGRLAHLKRYLLSTPCTVGTAGIGREE